MKIRPNTWDSAIASSVLIDNEYDLPKDMSGKIVLDIGAHIGSFALACQQRGAKRIICYEPDIENASILIANVGEDAAVRSEITVLQYAVTGLSYTDLGVRHLTEHDFDRGRNTGHVDVFGSADGTSSKGINDVIRAVGEPIDLLKLDCEGAEWEIFQYADFSNVRSLVAELHNVPNGDHPALMAFKGKSLQELAESARIVLRNAGFNVSIVHQGITSKLTASRTLTVSLDRKPVMLWVGDAVITTGYARVTERICSHLVNCGWDVHVLGIGYNGDPHRYPYKIYPAIDSNVGGHRNGLTRMKEIVSRVKPDICIIQDDSWNVGIITDNMAMLGIGVPTIGYVAVDSENVRAETAIQLRNLRHVICHTEFGIEQLRLAGYAGAASTAFHGVDTTIYTPYSREEARSGIPIPYNNIANAFIWGVVGQNQPRKRLDLSLAYWAAWWRQTGKPDNAYLYLHTMPDGVWDIRQLSDYLGIKGRVFSTEGGQRLSDFEMPSLYNAFDVCISTSEGESFGIPLLEGMACFASNTPVYAESVERGMSRPYSGDMIRIHVNTDYVEVTPNHPIWTAFGWQLAGDIQVGTPLLYNNLYGKKRNISDTIEKVVEVLQNDAAQRGRSESGHKSFQSNVVSSQVGYTEDTPGQNEISRCVVYNITADGISGRSNRRGRWSDYFQDGKVKGNRQVEMETCCIRNEYQHGADGMAGGRNGQETLSIQSSEAGTRSLLQFEYDGCVLSESIQSTGTSTGSEKRIDTSHNSLERDSVIYADTVRQEFASDREALKNCIASEAAEYKTITQIERYTVENISVFNLKTASGLYFAAGFLVHNCGIPNIAVECGGAPYWAGDSIYWVKPSYYQFTVNRINTKRWIASEADFVRAMQDMYENTELRDDYAKRGLEKAKQLTWTSAGDHFDAVLRKVLNAKKAAVASRDALAEF